MDGGRKGQREGQRKGDQETVIQANGRKEEQPEEEKEGGGDRDISVMRLFLRTRGRRH